MSIVRIGDIAIGERLPFALIAGPCVMEDRVTSLVARELKNVCAELQIPFIFKASYDKANRTSIHSYRGPGLEVGLEEFRRIKQELAVPVLTDVHETKDVEKVAQVVDVLQVPALLCRQTDLLLAVARTGKPVNIKKGQFLSPGDMQHVVEKVRSEGNHQVLVTERGTCFGYNNLVVDFRFFVMAQFAPLVFDATHSVQMPGASNGRSGGCREFVPFMARAAIATGAVSAIYLEVHPDPDNARCDGPNSLALADVPILLKQLKNIQTAIRG